MGQKQVARKLLRIYNDPAIDFYNPTPWKYDYIGSQQIFRKESYPWLHKRAVAFLKDFSIECDSDWIHHAGVTLWSGLKASTIFNK